MSDTASFCRHITVAFGGSRMVRNMGTRDNFSGGKGVGGRRRVLDIGHDVTISGVHIVDEEKFRTSFELLIWSTAHISKAGKVWQQGGIWRMLTSKVKWRSHNHIRWKFSRQPLQSCMIETSYARQKECDFTARGLESLEKRWEQQILRGYSLGQRWLNSLSWASSAQCLSYGRKTWPARLLSGLSFYSVGPIDRKITSFALCPRGRGGMPHTCARYWLNEPSCF